MIVVGRTLFVCFLLAFASAWGDDFSSLEEQMTVVEFRRAGLEKLTPEELAYLNEWLRSRGVSVTAAPAPRSDGSAPSARPTQADSDMGFRPKESERTTIYSRIDGPFEGWLGKTEFKLQNGQVWVQNDTDRFRYNAMNPEVRIEPAFMGTWRLYVEDLNRSVKVERIK